MSNQSKVPVTGGTGYNIDGTTTATAGNFRQAVTIADPTTDANYMPVHATLGGGVNILGANGTALDTNSGNVSAGTIRVVMATNQPTLTTPGVINITQITGATPSAGLPGVIPVGGGSASGSSSIEFPVNIGGLASTTLPGAVNPNTIVQALFDKYGRQIMRGSMRELMGSQTTAIVGSTTETTIINAVAGNFLDLYGLVLSNTTNVAVGVTIRDATSTGMKYVFEVPANDTRGFMLPTDSAIKQTAVNNNWTAQCDTAVNTLYVAGLYVKNV